MQENIQTDVVQDQTTDNQAVDNFDADLLNGFRVDPNDAQPVLNQALRIAVYDEYRAYETYKKILETYGDTEPFTNIIHAEVAHYQALIPLLEKYQIEIPVNDWEAKIVAPNSVLEACELGVAAEIENIKMYDDLISYVGDYPDVLDLMYRLQAASYNNHLPAFRTCVAKHSMPQMGANEMPAANPMQGLDEMMGKVDEFSAIAQKVSSGDFSQEDIMKLLSSNHVSMIGGAVLGAVGAGVVSQMIKDKEENTKNEENVDAK
jgi:rubrerythrin